MRASLFYLLAATLAGCATAADAGADDPASGKSDTTISINMCPGAVSTCSQDVIRARQAACASECTSSGHGKSRGIKYCFTGNPTGGFPAADFGADGPSAFCAPCDCADGSEGAPPVDSDGGVTLGGTCGGITYEGYCQDSKVLVFCGSGAIASLRCQSGSTCQIGACGPGAQCCPN
jgi:hypothetical protein